MSFGPGQIAWLQGQLPVKIVAINAERTLADVLTVERVRGTAVFHWRELRVAMSFLEERERGRIPQ